MQRMNFYEAPVWLCCLEQNDKVKYSESGFLGESLALAGLAYEKMTRSSIGRDVAIHQLPTIYGFGRRQRRH